MAASIIQLTAAAVYFAAAVLFLALCDNTESNGAINRNLTEVSGENNLCRQTFFASPFISKAAESDAARHKANDLFASAANGHTLFTRLFCAEQPVARVSQAGNYIAVVVKIFVYARKI